MKSESISDRYTIISTGTGALIPRVKQTGREADQPSPCTADVKNVGLN
jgi:hypothetical protein